MTIAPGYREEPHEKIPPEGFDLIMRRDGVMDVEVGPLGICDVSIRGENSGVTPQGRSRGDCSTVPRVPLLLLSPLWFATGGASTL